MNNIINARLLFKQNTEKNKWEVKKNCWKEKWVYKLNRLIPISHIVSCCVVRGILVTNEALYVESKMAVYTTEKLTCGAGLIFVTCINDITSQQCCHFSWKNTGLWIINLIFACKYCLASKHHNKHKTHNYNLKETLLVQQSPHY